MRSYTPMLLRAHLLVKLIGSSMLQVMEENLHIKLLILIGFRKLPAIQCPCIMALSRLNRVMRDDPQDVFPMAGVHAKSDQGETKLMGFSRERGSRG